MILGSGGVIRFGTFRNKTATRTHPIKRGVPSALSRKLEVPKGKKTVLRAVVSHHSHGDWELRVKVDGKIISKAEVSSKTTTDEWLTHEVDLIALREEKTVDLQLENNPTGWMNEWGYWNEVKVIIFPLGRKKKDKR